VRGTPWGGVSGTPPQGGMGSGPPAAVLGGAVIRGGLRSPHPSPTDPPPHPMPLSISGVMGFLCLLVGLVFPTPIRLNCHCRPRTSSHINNAPGPQICFHECSPGMGGLGPGWIFGGGADPAGEPPATHPGPFLVPPTPPTSNPMDKQPPWISNPHL